MFLNTKKSIVSGRWDRLNASSHPIQDPRYTQSRGLLKEAVVWTLRVRGKKYSLWGYVGKIKVNLRFEEVKIVLAGKAFSRESVPQGRVSLEEAVPVNLPSY